MTIEEIINDKFDEYLEITNSSFFKDKVVLVTGAGGSIGQKLSQTLLTTGVQQVILLDNSEGALFDIQQTLVLREVTNFIIELADITCKEAITDVFKKHQPDLVYHAAAYKHVPMLEDFPKQAFKVNVIGTKNILENAIKGNACEFVLISTDKAVHPKSVMGVSKRLAELYVSQYINKTTTNIKVVRFGNIPYTSGSVLLSWKKQLKLTGQINLVQSNMFRYFVSINQVCKMLLGIMEDTQKSLFISEMGNPVEMNKLATKFLLKNKREITDIKWTSKRPGEKEKEVLKYAEELTTKVEAANYSYGNLKTDSKQVEKVNNLIEKYNKHNKEELKSLFKEIVPEYNLV